MLDVSNQVAVQKVASNATRHRFDLCNKKSFSEGVEAEVNDEYLFSCRLVSSIGRGKHQGRLILHNTCPDNEKTVRPHEVNR